MMKLYEETAGDNGWILQYTFLLSPTTILHAMSFDFDLFSVMGIRDSFQISPFLPYAPFPHCSSLLNNTILFEFLSL